jgi:hypothetical protein
MRGANRFNMQSLADQTRKVGDSVKDVSDRIERLEDRLERLHLANIALWSLLREQAELTDVALIERIKELDLQDGALDGRLDRPPAECKECKRVLPARHNRCMYCGADGPYETALP